MSEDRPGSGTPGDGFSEEQVARLLASAGGAAPTPPDVTARLDAVLADLVAEREVTEAGVTEAGLTVGGAGTRATEDSDDARDAAPVVPLAERRARRTWAPRLLVAAVVLGLAGIGFSVADDLSGGSTSGESATAGDAAGSASEESGADSGAAAESSDDAAAGGGAGDRDTLPDRLQAPEAAAESMRLPAVLRITDTASLRSAVLATGGRDTSLPRENDEPDAGSLDSRSALKAASGACAVPRGPGRSTLVTYEGSLATLVVRREGDRLDGRVYDCDLGLQIDGVEIGPAEE